MDPASYPDIYVGGMSLHEGNRRHQLEMFEGWLRWIAADPAVALAADLAEQRSMGVEPEVDTLAFEIVMGYDYVEESLIKGQVPDEVLALHRELSEGLAGMFDTSDGAPGDGQFSDRDFSEGAGWALLRDRARQALILWGLERDDQLLFDQPSE
jgi:hypothetical protein